jgi:hypothetical protein
MSARAIRWLKGVDKYTQAQETLLLRFPIDDRPSLLEVQPSSAPELFALARYYKMVSEFLDYMQYGLNVNTTTAWTLVPRIVPQSPSYGDLAEVVAAFERLLVQQMITLIFVLEMMGNTQSVSLDLESPWHREILVTIFMAVKPIAGSVISDIEFVDMHTQTLLAASLEYERQLDESGTRDKEEVFRKCFKSCQVSRLRAMDQRSFQT